MDYKIQQLPYSHFVFICVFILYVKNVPRRSMYTYSMDRYLPIALRIIAKAHYSAKRLA
ncbi:hypothetical protein SAMN05660236_4616 [Ohtaekwangia koreensis]|uniref:Uncharacterized protein n=1 Tax=Ohtaekwangia koreensis TaxID=688867 RepID=A0A1T5M6W1_9BACT|nr:hypothetical protein SAMN05660236_4616 [Ohtaekwangia koreensis]